MVPWVKVPMHGVENPGKMHSETEDFNELVGLIQHFIGIFVVM